MARRTATSPSAPATSDRCGSQLRVGAQRVDEAHLDGSAGPPAERRAVHGADRLDVAASLPPDLQRPSPDRQRRGAPRRAAREQATAQERALQRAVAVHPAAAEPGHLARRVQARRAARRPRRAPGPTRSVCRPPRVLRVSTCSRTAISGPAAGSRIRCGAAVRISRSPRCRRALRIAITCRSLVNGLASSRSRATICRSSVARSSSGSSVRRVHARRRARAACRRRRSPAPWSRKAWTGAAGPGRTRASTPTRLRAGQVRVLLRAGERELLLDDLRASARTTSGRARSRAAPRGCRACRSPGSAGPGRRRPRASNHSDDGPGRIRMPCRGQIGSQFATPSV